MWNIERIIKLLKNYKIVLQYEGTRYGGWQRQRNTDNTIQGKLEDVLTKMAESPVEVHGSGRTDAGVHAQGQVANFHIDRDLAPDSITEYLNRYLPEDIRVLTTEAVSSRFHSRLNAKKKVYVYQIETGDRKDVFNRRLQYGLGKALDIQAMKQAADSLCGTHDYKSFCGNKKMKKSTVRTIERIDILREGTVVILQVAGNGFLQHMVRIIAGTLIEVGLGSRCADSIPEVLGAMDRQQAGYMAPAEGLCLAGVMYESSKQSKEVVK
ncbi:MAG: tRNA pseudouridine(38-40) synthase TruA [Lachnospiraceae bacterium]